MKRQENRPGFSSGRMHISGSGVLDASNRHGRIASKMVINFVIIKHLGYRNSIIIYAWESPWNFLIVTRVLAWV